MIASHISEVIRQSQRDYVEIVLWINLTKLISERVMAVNHLINYPRYNCISSCPNLFSYLNVRCAFVCAHLWCEFCYLYAEQVNKLSNFTTEHRYASYTRDVTKDATSNTTQKEQRALINKTAEMWFSLLTRKLSSCSKNRRPQNNFFWIPK